MVKSGIVEKWEIKSVQEEGTGFLACNQLNGSKDNGGTNFMLQHQISPSSSSFPELSYLSSGILLKHC
jgi:hypothetical protein